jgi:CheY-like chemotaxis protein
MSRPALLGTTILVVEDHDETRDTIAEVLTQAGAHVLAAASAQAAILMLEDERPNLLVSDIEMPDVDGWSLVRTVRALPPERGGLTPAVALTVHNSREDRAKSLRAGFQLHLPKPFEPEPLADLLAALLASERRDPAGRREP